MRFLIPRFFSYTTQLQHGVLINLFVVQQRNYKAFHLFNPSYVRLNLFKLFLRYNNHLCTPLSIQFILVVTEWAYFNFFVAGSINSRPKQSVVKISVLRSRDFEVKVRRDRTWAIPTNWCVLGAKAFFSLTPSAFIVWRRSWRSKQKFLNWQSLAFPLYLFSLFVLSSIQRVTLLFLRVYQRVLNLYILLLSKAFLIPWLYIMVMRKQFFSDFKLNLTNAASCVHRKFAGNLVKWQQWK